MVIDIYVIPSNPTTVKLSWFSGDMNLGTITMPKSAWELINPMINWGNTFYEDSECFIAIHQREEKDGQP